MQCVLSNGEKHCSHCGHYTYLQTDRKCFDCVFEEECFQCKKKDILNKSNFCYGCSMEKASRECKQCQNYNILWQDELCSPCLKKNGVRRCRMCYTIVGISSLGVCLYCHNECGDLSKESSDTPTIIISGDCAESSDDEPRLRHSNTRMNLLSV